MNRCDEEDGKGGTKLSAQTLNRVLEQFKNSSELNLILDNIGVSFQDYRKFFHLFLKPLRFYGRDSESFKLAINLITVVARGLLRNGGESAETMFQELFLAQLLQIGHNEHKRGIVSQLVLQFVRHESESYCRLIQRIKQLYTGDLRTLSSLLARFLEKIAKSCEQIKYALWSQFYYYGFLSLQHSAPSTRVSGAKILSRLFTDVILVSSDMLTEKLPLLQNMVLDSWWEVRAQALIIFKAILLARLKNQTPQSPSQQEQDQKCIDEELNTKTILHYISQIFTTGVSHNILRIGLIQLAELTNFQESFCERYLQILIHVGPQIRSDVLNSSLIKSGPVVYGANTFNYQLTGAPLLWNSLGIAQELKNHIQKNAIQSLSLPFLEILFACVSKNAEIGKNCKKWLALFEQIKSILFETLFQEQLCKLSLLIIKEFLSVKEIHSEILSTSSSQITRVLNKVYQKANNTQGDNLNLQLSQKQKTIQTNILELFEYLKQDEAEHTYKILKNFAERQKDKYLGSNLIDFMNDLSRDRRKLMFSE